MKEITVRCVGDRLCPAVDPRGLPIVGRYAPFS